MKSLSFALVTSLALLGAGAVSAQVSVQDPWVRATVPQQKSTGAFMKLTTSADARLVEVKSPVAGAVEIHEMRMDNNVMRMRAVPGVDVKAGKGVELAPGGYHVMLMDLKQQVKEGDSVPLSLVFEGADKKRQTVEVKAGVRPLAAAAKKVEHKHDHSDPNHKH